MSQATEARKIFVDNYRKLKKFFGEALIEEINQVYDNKKDSLNTLLFYLRNADAPAQLWDGVDERERSCLWNALVDSVESKAEVLNGESKDCTDLSVVWQNIDPLQDEEDDIVDEDEDDDALVIPNVLYHGSPKDNDAAILSDGITVGLNGKITLFEDPKKAANLSARHVGGDTSQVIVYAVNTENIDKNMENYDFTFQDYGHGKVWEINCNIPTEYITSI